MEDFYFYSPRSGDCELGEDDAGHAGLDDDAGDRLEAHDEDRHLALLRRGSAMRVWLILKAKFDRCQTFKIELVQGDQSGSLLGFVDIKMKAAFQYMFLILKRNLCFDVNNA